MEFVIKDKNKQRNKIVELELVEECGKIVLKGNNHAIMGFRDNGTYELYSNAKEIDGLSFDKDRTYFIKQS